MSILVNPAKGMSSLQLSSSKHHTSRKVQQYDSGVELRSGSESKESVLRVYSVASSHKGQDTNDILLFKYLAAIRKLEQIDEIHHLRKKNRRKFMEMRYQLSNNLWPESDADIVVEDDLESYAETMVIPALTDFYLSNFEIIDHRTASSEVLDITNELETTQDKEVYISMSVKEKLEDDGMFLEDLDGMSLENLEVSDLDQELQSDSERRQEEVVALDTITKRDEDTDELSYFERTKNGDESTDSLKTAYDEKVQVNRYVKDQLKEESKCLESFQILPSYQEYQSEIEPVSSEATVAGDATADQAEYLSDFDTTKRSSENSKPLEGLEEKLKAAEREFKKNFDSIWSNLELKIIRSNSTDGIQTANFIKKLDRQHTVMLLLQEANETIRKLVILKQCLLHAYDEQKLENIRIHRDVTRDYIALGKWLLHLNERKNRGDDHATQTENQAQC